MASWPTATRGVPARFQSGAQGPEARTQGQIASYTVLLNGSLHPARPRFQRLEWMLCSMPWIT
eukprot:scaffold707_cov399-Prasinococcus_capsulatus_cf.AAC.27